MTGSFLPGMGVDATVPNIARVYDYLLGGKNHFAADRELANVIEARVEGAREGVLENRRFLGRATQAVARTGIRQFLDIGTGLPTQGAVHEVARNVNRDCRVVYVDNDPVVITHARALLTREGNAAVVRGDLRKPADILVDQGVADLINFDEPVALMLVALLHFVSDDARPHDLVRALVDALAPGSAVVISHVALDPRVIAAAAAYAEYGASESAHLRSRKEIRAFFDGAYIIEPGLVPVADWRPDDISASKTPWCLGGVGAVGTRRRGAA